jgi:hypothetical protein
MLMKMNQIAWLAAGSLTTALVLSSACMAAQDLDRSSRSVPAAPSAAVAAPPDGTPVALRLEGTRLRTALEMLFTGSGLQLAIEPAVPNYPITLNLHGIPFNTALRTLLRLAPGVTYRKEGDIYIVGLRQPAPEPTATGSEPQPPVETASAAGGEQVVRIPLNYLHPAILAYVLNGRLVPTEDQFQPGGGGLGGYGGGFNGPAGGGVYGGQNGGGLGPAGYGVFGNGSLNGFTPRYGTSGSSVGGLGQGLAPNVIVNPSGNSVVVAPQPRRF